MSRVIIVDDKDIEIGLKTYAELKYEYIYRVTALWLTDLENEYCLLTQRKMTKKNDPGKWMMAVSGTVEERETYESNIVKETEEEIGLKGIEIEPKNKAFVDDGLHKFFVQYFVASVYKNNTKIIIQEDEVEQYRWILIEDLIKWLKEKPEDFVPSMELSLNSIGVF